VRKLLFLGGLAALGVALANRRRLPPERLDLYREDGALQTFEGGSDLADRTLPLARDILSL
jgi:hypothetical protein